MQNIKEKISVIIWCFIFSFTEYIGMWLWILFMKHRHVYGNVYIKTRLSFLKFLTILNVYKLLNILFNLKFYMVNCDFKYEWHYERYEK